MRLLSLLFLLSIFYLPPIRGQVIEYSSPQKRFKTTYSKVIAENNDGFFVLKGDDPIARGRNNLSIRDNRSSVHFVDNNLNILWNTELGLPSFDSEIKYVTIADERLYVFYDEYNKSNSTYELRVFAFEVKSGKKLSRELALSSVMVDKKKSQVKFYVARNYDASKFFVLSYLELERGKKAHLQVNGFNSNLDEIYSFSKEEVLSNEDLNFLRVFVNSQGDFLAFGNNADRDRVNSNTIDHFLFHLNTQSNELLKIKIEHPDYYIDEANAILDDSRNKLMITGFFTEQKEFANSGVFLMNYDMAARKIGMSNFQTFKAKLLSDFKEGNENTLGRTLYNYKISEVALRDDGGVILMAESQFITESSTFNVYSQVYSTSFTYHYNNVVLFSLDPKGSISWESVLRKRQVSENDLGTFSSYALFLDANKLYLVYNQSIKRRTPVMLYTVSNSGQTDEKILVDEREESLIFPSGSRQISGNELIVPCLIEGKDSFMRLIF